MQAAELETTCMIYHELINASSINTPGILNVMENVHFKYLPWIIHSHNSNSKNVDFHDNTPLTAKPIKNISINFNITFYWFVLFRMSVVHIIRQLVARLNTAGQLYISLFQHLVTIITFIKLVTPAVAGQFSIGAGSLGYCIT